MAAQLAPLWPLRQQTTAPKDAAAEAQRQIEAEYAAAELAAAAPSAATPWITSAWDKGAASITDALQQASSNDTWSELYAASTESLSKNYDQWVTSGGWQETLPPLVAHVRRQHNRLVLREALLREMDRRFLEMPLDRDFPPLDPKPRYRGPSRRLMLAAADVLKSLSQSLTVAAEQLEAASRQDVAELHTPSENREEKR